MSDQPSLTLFHAGQETNLRPGDQLTFGRAPAPPDVATSAAPAEPPRHLGLSTNPRLHQLAGRIDVDGAGWVLTNTGRWLHLRVVEQGGPNRVELHPGRAVRIPYARCRIEITTGDETVGFDAVCPWLDQHGPDLDDTGAGAGAPVASSPTVGGLGLDRSAGYFRALVALCAPRLRDPQSEDVSSVGEIVRMLNQLPQEPERVTAKAVERRLAHVRRKLGLAASDPYGGSAAGLELRDAARQLADLVLRTGAVTVADLRLLDPTADPGDSTVAGGADAVSQAEAVADAVRGSVPPPAGGQGIAGGPDAVSRAEAVADAVRGAVPPPSGPNPSPPGAAETARSGRTPPSAPDTGSAGPPASGRQAGSGDSRG